MALRVPRSLVLLVGRIPSWAQKEGPHTRNAAKDLEVMVATQFRFVVLGARGATGKSSERLTKRNEFTARNGRLGAWRDDIRGGACCWTNGEINGIGQCIARR